MFELDKNNFARFLTEQRKAKGYTQKELAEKLFVSDKAVSKWERSLSMPDISLLIPLANILGTSVTELLEGRRLDPEGEMKTGQVEALVKKALTFSEEAPEQLRRRRRKNAGAFCAITLLMILEAAGAIWFLSGYLSGKPTVNDVALTGSLIVAFVLGGLSFFFGIYFWFFIKDHLPLYYDENEIGVYQDGIFQISLPGMCFNNCNWPHITKFLRLWAAVTMVTVPPICLLLALIPGTWLSFGLPMAVVFFYLAGLFVPLYVLGKKYKTTQAAPTSENVPDSISSKTGAGRKSMALIFVALIPILTLLIICFAVETGETRSGVRVGYISGGGRRDWSASYRLLNGWVSKTIHPEDGLTLYVMEIQTEQGTLSIEMTDSSGTVIYSAPNIQPGTYEVTLADKTKIKVTGEEHRGSFSIAPKP